MTRPRPSVTATPRWRLGPDDQRFVRPDSWPFPCAPAGEWWLPPIDGLAPQLLAARRSSLHWEKHETFPARALANRPWSCRPVGLYRAVEYRPGLPLKLLQLQFYSAFLFPRTIYSARGRSLHTVDRQRRPRKRGASCRQ